jgi:hypothetical protein
MNDYFTEYNEYYKWLINEIKIISYIWIVTVRLFTTMT